MGPDQPAAGSRPAQHPRAARAALPIRGVSRRYQAPELLADRHRLDTFACRSAEQTQWLRRYARQSAATGTTKVFVVTEQGRDVVVAYYGWCMAQIALADAPTRVRRGAGRYPQPVVL